MKDTQNLFALATHSNLILLNLGDASNKQCKVAQSHLISSWLYIFNPFHYTSSTCNFTALRLGIQNWNMSYLVPHTIKITATRSLLVCKSVTWQIINNLIIILHITSLILLFFSHSQKDVRSLLLQMLWINWRQPILMQPWQR